VWKATQQELLAERAKNSKLEKLLKAKEQEAKWLRSQWEEARTGRGACERQLKDFGEKSRELLGRIDGLKVFSC
jgi:chromosome segregation ATPase